MQDLKTSVTVKLTTVDHAGVETVFDQFNLDVVEDSRTSSSLSAAAAAAAVVPPDDRTPPPVRCLPTASVTTATVVIDADAGGSSGEERATAVRAFARHLNLPPAAVRYLPASRAPLDDRSALVAGVGDAARTAGRGGVVLQWEVGCGNVLAAHMDRLQRVETTAADGSMSAALGRGVVGWHVANKKPTAAGSKHQRQRRAVHRLSPTATPVVVVIPPTSRPVPTHTVKEPDPTRVPPSRVVATTPTTAVTERRRTRRPRTRRPRPGRSTTPSTLTRPTSTVRPPYIEPSTTPEVLTTTRSVMTATPPLPPPVTSDLHWTGIPLHVNVHCFEILRRKIPDDLFDGEAPGRLRLRLLTADGLELSEWLRLDASTSQLVGMPLETHVGQQMYVLEATDSAGRVARATVFVGVRLKTVYNAAFEADARLALDYDRFTRDLALRLDVARAIARGFGDRDASQLAVMGIGRGSVRLS